MYIYIISCQISINHLILSLFINYYKHKIDLYNHMYNTQKIPYTYMYIRIATLLHETNFQIYQINR